ncbi:tRNA (mnm(5)s(2)U34)-methyltransferase [Cohnella terricola]|uniref:SAM-dependent methyltransferase n=1 Tax=Cohnella terricola TaxID=1289167 RepID=A0A559JEI0_9BACL|nr:class I SAM-dependent methyltransferase [Cohnella terricola]TVX98270.1 SAM-dependent methyltransferase [Cohnella terricola]
MGFLSVLSQAQRWVKERAESGDIVVDATAGNGSDTLFLSRAVGPQGLVYAFDVQAEALASTERRLSAEAEPSSLSPVKLVLAGHETMGDVIPTDKHGRIAAAMFNLGYLPGASSPLITKPETTLAALDTALKLLRSGGILTVVVYPGHEGGLEEADAVTAWAAEVPQNVAQAVLYRFPQKAASPNLIALNKK